ncbi:MAG: elongation factor 1-beta [Candidatus Micrarchaeota archaeon]
MYDVMAVFKIFAEDSNNLGVIRSAIEKLEIGKVHSSSEEDIGFGIKVLKVIFLLNDDSGGMDALEEKIRGISGVSQVEVEDVSRV